MEQNLDNILFPLADKDVARFIAFRLRLEINSLGIGCTFLIVRIIHHWKALPRIMEDFLSLAIFNCVGLLFKTYSNKNQNKF